ncbi:MAG: YdeI/OmpD-associated family protein [Acidiferrobacterales bacterium]|nr:YdeI/OmpD-associated family protein [Acidiferrobacterales bacterium]
MKKRNPKVDAFLERANSWQTEMKKLRKILLDCQLTEELKWAKPCYTYQGHNIVIVQGFKDFCAVLFPKGALLKDAKKLLEKPGKNTQAGRRLTFADGKQITGMESTIKAYVREAIKVEKAGLKVALKKKPEPVPEELQDKLNANPTFKSAFKALTPGRQRAYILYFSAAKQAKTRAARIEKYAPKILKGQGLNDR